MIELGRIEIIAGLVLLAGVILCARGAWRFARAVRARFTYGAPYHSGMIQDRLLGLLLEILVLAVGAGLAFLALGQAGFQINEATVRVGQVEAHRAGWARVAIRLIPDPLYPGGRVLEGEVDGARWAITGDFIEWERGMKWLGLRDGHRVRYLVGAGDTTGTTRSEKMERVLLDPLPRAAATLLALHRFIPFLKVTSESSPWFTLADRQVIVLYAIGPGYLGQVAEESARPATGLPRVVAPPAKP